MNNYKKRGFTLFELLVSISIIGILTAIASVSFSTAQKKARDARRMEDVNAVAKAAETFYAVNSAAYPTSNVIPWQVGGEVILAVWPSDPKGTSYTNQYAYTNPSSDSTTFCMCAYMENSANANATAGDCTFNTGGNWYCIKNQQ